MVDETYRPETDVTGLFPQLPRDVTLLGGHKYLRNSVLAKIESGPNAGKATLADKTAEDGSDVVLAVLRYEVDATAGDTSARATVSGQFNPETLVYKSGEGQYTAADIADAKQAPGTLLNFEVAPGFPVSPNA